MTGTQPRQVLPQLPVHHAWMVHQWWMVWSLHQWQPDIQVLYMGCPWYICHMTSMWCGSHDWHVMWVTWQTCDVSHMTCGLLSTCCYWPVCILWDILCDKENMMALLGWILLPAAVTPQWQEQCWWILLVFILTSYPEIVLYLGEQGWSVTWQSHDCWLCKYTLLNRLQHLKVMSLTALFSELWWFQGTVRFTSEGTRKVQLHR